MFSIFYDKDSFFNIFTDSIGVKRDRFRPQKAGFYPILNKFIISYLKELKLYPYATLIAS